MLDIIWDQSYSVNIVEIDRQNQKFTAMLDMLFEAIEAGRHFKRILMRGRRCFRRR